MSRGAYTLAILVCLATPRSSAQSADERAVGDLARRFFTAYAEQALPAIEAAVSSGAPDRAALVSVGPVAGSSSAAVLARPVGVGRIRIDDSRATAQVFIELAAGPSPSTGVVSAERLLLCAREGSGWQVWNVTPSLMEVVDGVTNAASRTARLGLLGDDGAWLGADLWPAIVARGDQLFQQGR